MNKRKLLLAATLVLCAAQAKGQHLWTGVIDTSRAIDWTNAGAPNINETRTQCTTTACNTVSSGTTVTAASINSAISSASAHQYVLLPSGSFTLTGNLVFGTKDSITLRGAGANSTFLTFSSPSNNGTNCSDGSGRVEVICAAGDNNYVGSPVNSANWTAGYSQGTTVITLSSTTNLAVGNPIILDQLDTTSDPGEASSLTTLYEGCEMGSSVSGDSSTDCYSGAGTNGFERGIGSLSTLRGQQQIVTVTNISGSNVTISPPLYASNWNSGKSPGAWWATSPRHDDGVENLSFSTTSSYVGINFYNCQGCWVKGVRGVIASGTTSTAFCLVCSAVSNKITVRDSYFYGASGDTYGIAPEVTSDLLVENNIFHNYIAIALPNSDCEDCVYDYNYQPGVWNSLSSSEIQQSSEPHGVTNFMLWEGDIEMGINFDSFHGTHNLNTVFRNMMTGDQQLNGSITVNNNNNVAIKMQPGTRYTNIIGNVLGTPGYHTTYEGTVSGGTFSKSVIGCGFYPDGMGSTQDTLSCPTSMFWGNWDSVTNGVRWNSSEVPSGLPAYANAVPSSHTLPASLIYGATPPTWWPTGRAWPAIGPDVTAGNVGQCSGGTNALQPVESSASCTGGGTFSANAMVVSNPAMDCYLNTMSGPPTGSGSALAFNASTCYTASSLTSTSTSLGSSNNSPTAGTNITLTATLTPSSGPTGTVEFFDGGSAVTGCTAVAVSSGSAACTITAITAGTHLYTATYSGDGTYATSTSSTDTVTASSVSIPTGPVPPGIAYQ